MTTTAAAPAHAQNQKLMELLAMDKMTLSSKARPPQSATDRWMRYLGFPGGIALFLLILYLPPGAGLSASAQAGAIICTFGCSTRIFQSGRLWRGIMLFVPCSAHSPWWCRRGSTS